MEGRRTKDQAHYQRLEGLSDEVLKQRLERAGDNRLPDDRYITAIKVEINRRAADVARSSGVLIDPTGHSPMHHPV